MGPAELERTTVDIIAEVAATPAGAARRWHRRELRRFPRRLRRRQGRSRPTKRTPTACRQSPARNFKSARTPIATFHRAAVALHRSLIDQEHGRARHWPALDLRLDPPGAAGPQLCPARQARLVPEDRPDRDGIPRELLPQARRIRFHRRPRREARRDFRRRTALQGCAARLLARLHVATDSIKDLRVAEVLDALNVLLADHIFPPKPDGTDPRRCPNCGTGQMALKLGKFGAFIGCSNYPDASTPGSSRPVPTARPRRALGDDPETKLEAQRALSRAASAHMCNSAKHQNKRRSGEAQACPPPQGGVADDIDLDRAAVAGATPRGRPSPGDGEADQRGHRPLRPLHPA